MKLPDPADYDDEDEFLADCEDAGGSDSACQSKWDNDRSGSPGVERRFIHSASVKVATRADGKPVITGYASVFFKADDPGTEYALWDDLVEHIMPTAFDRAAKEDDCRGLYNHDVGCLLGRTVAGTCRLSVDSKGLKYELDPPDNELGRSVCESIRRGDLSGSSFAFTPTDTTWREVKEGERTKVIREINAVTLYDVGPVVYPAYESATTGLRATDNPREARRAYAAWRRGQKPAGKPLGAILAGYRARAVEISS